MDPVQAFLQANALTPPAFPPTSRYHGIETAQLVQADGRVVAYVRRRFVPPPEAHALVRLHAVSAGDRLDNLAARYLGDPAQFWRLCDANRALRPEALVETAGAQLRITLPHGIPGVGDAG
jgi:hypothetical protein